MTPPLSHAKDRILEAVGLHVSFGKGALSTVAVDDVSFAIARGEAYGLIGESGCGKSTILRTIAGLVDSYDGALLFGNKELPRKRDKDFFRRMQMVFQDPYGSLHPRKMVETVLAEPLTIHKFDNPRKRIDAVLEAVGLGPSFRFRYPHELSGGQRQRVAIARALVNRPSIILADEPTGNLDSKTGDEIMALFDELHANGNTIIVVTHEPDIAEYAHRVVTIRDGVIASDHPSARIHTRSHKPTT